MDCPWSGESLEWSYSIDLDIVKQLRLSDGVAKAFFNKISRAMVALHFRCGQPPYIRFRNVGSQIDFAG